MQRVASLYIASSDDRGRGVFTASPIHEGDIIEVCPVIVIPKRELPIIHKTILHDYYFLWGDKLEDCAIALGYGSMYNHELNPNANFILDLENMTIDIEAIQDIAAGEEITLNYHGEPGDESELWF
ncbi:MAG: SET domain-containing protein-lysine N-methyltransferase [Saprospiraceae bacterium]|nr:SET domain-containing protein-lysine N-methyltransferase [Saprospiraceae bacterium]MBK7787488.1 SET domain-containing protein-lysine N-methyltransferase [Saprospiraceae bacterium]MBK8109698.1 SET domain-containing protein-lysine N-methyltransferase [Saprospiraceae bacterium]MBK8849210.1 SET domain-containing protein-lysine N-methyltransferase [Saprospiraceae bacterium]MBK9688853.1 SET domain-containing protein-lysine N-methyltransferase [Saprospiraceae bacterium]